MIVSKLLIDDAVTDGYLSELSVFVRLKSLFSNSCIFRATYRNVSRLSGIGVSKLKQCIPFFKSMGWVREHHGNLTFLSLDSLDGSKGRRQLEVDVNKDDTYKSILKKLRLALVRASHDGFKYVQKVTGDDKKVRMSSKMLKHRRRYTKIHENLKFSISNRKIGGMIERSKSTASRLMKWASSNGLVTVTPNRVTVLPVAMNVEMPGYFVSGKSLVRQKANFVSFK